MFLLFISSQLAIPPLCIRDHAVVVFVHLGEKPVELGARDCYSRIRKGIPQFCLIDFSIVVSVDALKHLPESFLGVVEKCAEFWRW